ncbi:glycoside hydrolase family 3 N-terminal domain-containing protein [Streptomyces sp. NPDC002588]|uniref:glycoside hydrolase family 3 N-terminal domain-containing protein n=1 Tax=Streptomyces sp. NPDC002588 TaxID=3154419 RepID=UPI0033280E13
MTALPDDLVEAANRCLVLGFDGTTLPGELKRLADTGLGGVILHTRNVAGRARLRELTDELRSIRPGLLVTVDQEGGGISHLARAGAPETPGAWALGVADDTALTAAVANALARHLAECGVGVSFAPVADVHRVSANPIVRTRAFGADPGHAARHVTAWIEATLAAGVAPCVKHFPGHGSTTVDSHLSVALDAREERVLREIDLLPFQAAVAAGVPLVMTAHVVYPALDAAAPATLSRRVLTGLLRGELGFQGVIVTDALEMEAIAGGVGEAAGAVAAIAAGADQVVIARPEPQLWLRCRDALLDAMACGALDPARVLDAARRVDALAERFAQPPATGLNPGSGDVGLFAARRAVRWKPLPGPVLDPFVVDLHRPPHPALEWARTDLVALLREAMPGTDGVVATQGPVDVAGILRRAQGRPLLIATEDADLHPWQAAARTALLTGRPDALLVATGMPDAETEAADGLCAYGRGRANLRAVAEALL